MSLFRVADDSLEAVPRTTFASAAIKERDDLQRLLRADLSVLDDGLLLVAEEYALFDGSQRRVDLLALDRSARLVVIELKRSNDGGHMELQALRYAAMVSTMTYDHLVDVYARTHGSTAEDARTSLDDWVDDSDDLAVLSTRVRVILASADFSTEITATVLWLTQEYGLDVACYRLVPYRLGQELLLDVQRIIPLPEATDFQIQQRVKGAASAAALASGSGRDFTKYDVRIGDVAYSSLSKQSAIRTVVAELLEAGVAPQALRSALTPNRWVAVRPVDGESVEQAFRRERPLRGGHYWFDLGVTDVDAAWVLPRLGGRRTEQHLRTLEAIAPASVPVTWSAVSSTS